MTKKFIRDSIYGDIKLTEFEENIINQSEFQRLRRIKQLGFINLVYPGANHSRFEHSIGTMHLASRLANELNLNEKDTELIRISALLHDLGHAPFSHVTEGVLSFKHEEMTEYLIKNSSITPLLEKKFNTEDIIEIIHGKGYLGPIISGELDVDRMDYLLRDSHNTGVVYGVIDYERIISNFRLGNSLYLDIKGVQAAEGALVSRYFMYPSVYQHHTTRVLNSTFRRIMTKLFKAKLINEKEIYKFDDADLIVLARNTEGIVSDLMKRIDNRHFFKRVKTIHLNTFKQPEKIYKIKQKTLRKAEKEISEDFNIDKDNVIINIAEFPRLDEMKTQILLEDKLYPLTEISNIVGALSAARFNIPDINLYVPEEDKDKFKKIKLENYLDLPEKDESKFHKIHPKQTTLI